MKKMSLTVCAVATMALIAVNVNIGLTGKKEKISEFTLKNNVVLATGEIDYDPNGQDKHGLYPQSEECTGRKWDSGCNCLGYCANGTQVWCKVDTFFGGCDAHSCQCP